MKKILLFLIGIFMLPVIVLADEYMINDLDMKVEIPENYIVITRDNYINNPELEELNVSSSYMEQSFNLLDVYLDALDKESMEEIFISAQHSNMKNTKEQTYDETKKYIKEVSNKITGEQTITHEMDLKEIGDLKYYIVGYFDESYKFYVYNYFMVHNGISYNIKFQSSSEFNDEDIKRFENIVKSIKYSDKLLKLSDISTTEEKEDEKKDNNNLSLIVVISAISIVLISGIVLLIRKIRTKKTTEE